MARSLFLVILIVAAVMCQSIATGANVTNGMAPPENLAVHITDHDHVVSVAESAGLHAPASAFLGTKFFSRLDDVANKVIDDAVVKLGNAVPNVLEKLHIPTYKFESEGKKHISLEFEGPHDVVLRADNFKLTIPETKFHVLSLASPFCPGHFTASINNMSVTIRYTLASGAGLLKTAQVKTTADYKDFNIKHWFDGSICNIAMTVHKLIINEVDKLLKKELRKTLPSFITPAAGINFQEKPFRLPLYFTEAPMASATGVNSTVEMFKMNSILRSGFQPLAIDDEKVEESSEVENAVVERAVDTQASKGINDRDVGLYLSAKSASSVIEAYYRTGLLNILDFGISSKIFSTKNLEHLAPLIYLKCRDCALKLGLRWSTAPTVTFSHNRASIHVKQLSLGLTAVSSGGKTVPLFTTQIDGSFGLKNFQNRQNNILFSLDAGDMKYSSHLTGHSFDSKLVPDIQKVFDKVVNTLLNKALVPTFNMMFKGFPIFVPTSFVIADTLIAPEHGSLKIAFNVK